MASRRTRLAKSHRTYTIADAAVLYECHRNTVRHWLKQGLEPIEGPKPILIHGSALNDFHAKRRREGKRPCAPGEIYCLPCRKPQRPNGGLFDYLPITASTGKVTAICPGCDRVMHQRVNQTRLLAFEEHARAARRGNDD